MNARRSVRRFCLECQGESAPAVRDCADRHCALWAWRLPEAPAEVLEACIESLGGTASCALGSTESALPLPGENAGDIARDPRVRKQLLRCALRAIRRHCLNCAGDRHEVRVCAARAECVLWSWRFGVQPETYKIVRQRFFAPRKLSLFP